MSPPAPSLPRSPPPSPTPLRLPPLHKPARPSPRPGPSLSAPPLPAHPPQPVLSRKHEALLFLYALAASPRTPAPPFLAALHPPATRPPSAAPSPVDPRLPNKKSKADILRDYRARTGTSPLARPVHTLTQQAQARIPEHLLLRDTLYLLQGISGKHVQLAFSDQDDINSLVFLDDTVHPPSFSLPFLTRTQRHIIPSPVRSLIHRLAEVGHLYSRVDAFVKDSQRRSAVGMIEQSLCHHLQAQLTEYYRLVAILESQMSIPNTDTDPDIPGRESGLTLKRLDVWVNDWRLRMRMMSVCVEGARGTPFKFTRIHPPEAHLPDAQGGALVNLIHSYTDNGDPFVRKFTDQLLEEVRRLPICPQTRQLQTGIQTLLFHPAQMALFRRALRSLQRVLCVCRPGLCPRAIPATPFVTHRRRRRHVWRTRWRRRGHVHRPRRRPSALGDKVPFQKGHATHVRRRSLWEKGKQEHRPSSPSIKSSS